MADDIFIAPPPVATRKVRWHEVVIGNPYMGTPMLHASAQTMDMTAGAQVVRIERAPAFDLTIAFDPDNPDHVAFATLADKIVKDAHNAKMAEAGNG